MDFKLEKDKKILILMPYYNRPQRVKLALNSIRNQKYKNWILAFIDDGSDEPGENIVRSFFDSSELSKVIFYKNNETLEDKLKRKEAHPDLLGADSNYNGFFFVPFLNKALRDLDYDLVIFLCDDDFLHENYLYNLNNHYKNNPELIYSYCNVSLYDFDGEYIIHSGINNHRLTRDGPLNGFFNLDTSQVSWRAEVHKRDNLYMIDKFHIFFDAYWYELLYRKYGACYPNYLLGQFKNVNKNLWIDTNTQPMVFEYEV